MHPFINDFGGILHTQLFILSTLIEIGSHATIVIMNSKYVENQHRLYSANLLNLNMAHKKLSLNVLF